MMSFRSAVAVLVLTAAAVPFAVAAPRDDFDVCYRQTGDVAIDACTRAIASGRYKGRDLAVLYSNRGSEWYDKKNNDRAMRDHDEAIRIDPGYGAAYSNRGNVFSSLGQRERAIEDYNEALRINPRDARVLNNRGDEYALIGKYDLALKDLDAAIRLEPNPVRLSNRCLVRTIVGQLPGAVSDCNRSLSMRKRNAVVHGRRGLAYLKMGRLDQARKDFDAALQISSDQALSLYGRGLIKLSKGDTAAGNADLSAAKSSVPGIVDQYAKYGVQVDKFINAVAPLPPLPKVKPAPAVATPAKPAPAPPPPPSAKPAPELAVPVKPEPAPPPVTPAPALAAPVKSEPALPALTPTPAMAAPASPLPAASPSSTIAAPAPSSHCARAETHWKSAEDIKTIAAYEDHLRRFPDCDFATLAKVRIEMLKR